MSSSAPILLILGAGPKVGAAIAKTFLHNGYKVASASRSLTDGQKNDNELSINLDLGKPEDVQSAFVKVKKAFGGVPSVVVHNAYSNHSHAREDPLFNVTIADYITDINVNSTSVLIAAKIAVEGFKTLPPTTKKTFIFTGNALAVMPLPSLLTFGMGKSAGAHLIMSAAEAYKKDGYRFYFGDERNQDGSPCVQGVDGPAHAEAYLRLAESSRQEQWYYTFVKGSPGYVDFGAPKL